ncbi:hypothetical protein ACJ2A9_21295 [Anaerobacillus sp. MEB173]|uniref:hypothetical protein n=1 Tax=Anaerobacillus sp. MEB173 TaxID=3383345 RepID=UPI003F8EA224
MSRNKKIKTIIYCGPSLKNLPQYSVFRGEPPEYVKWHMKQSGIVKELFVETGEFGRIRRNIKTQGTRENHLYLKALEYARGANN